MLIDKFKQVLSSYDNRVPIGTDKFGSEYIIKKVREHVNLSGMALDVGCGNSYIGSTYLNMVNSSYIGVDISHNALKILHDRDNVNVVMACAEKLPFKNGIFDILFCIGAMEHFMNMEEFLKEALRVSRQHAWFIIQLPNRMFPKGAGTSQEIDRSFSIDESIKLLRNNGMLLCHIDKYDIDERVPLDLAYEHIFTCIRKEI